MTLIRISDVRQYAFCPRVIWHRNMMGQAPPATPKMELGNTAEAALTKLEKRRSLRRYRLEGAARKFQVLLESGELGLTGVCDLVLEVPEGTIAWPDLGTKPPAGLKSVLRVVPSAVYPVEVKTTRGGVGRHHVLQLTGYAMLLSGVTRLRVDTGFVLLLPEDRIVPVPITSVDRDEFILIVRSIRQMLELGNFPPATRHATFCPECEHLNFCGDVL